MRQSPFDRGIAEQPLADRKRVGDVERRRGVVSEDVAANSTDGALGQQYSVAIDSRGSSQLDDATLRLQLLGASAGSHMALSA